MDRRFGRLMAQVANLWAERVAGQPYGWQTFYPPPSWPIPGAGVEQPAGAAVAPAPAPAPGTPARQTAEQMEAIMASFVAHHHASGASRKGWAPRP